MHYVTYLDDFGHIGPFIARNDPRYCTSPIFGLAGLILPVDDVRSFATWFFKLKCNLLKFEIDRDGKHPAKWEKKGSALYTTKNALKYKELRNATNRILNRINRHGGHIFYVGTKKNRDLNKHNSKNLYISTLRESIKRLNQFCETRNSHFQLILDQTEDKLREKAVEVSGLAMFGEMAARKLIEPPMQIESHLYQTLQCADWICGLIGRYGCHLTEPKQYEDFEWATKYFSTRIAQASVHSGIRH